MAPLGFSLSRSTESFGSLQGGAANLCFGRGEYASTLFILAEGAVISLELHGTTGAL